MPYSLNFGRQALYAVRNSSLLATELRWLTGDQALLSLSSMFSIGSIKLFHVWSVVASKHCLTTLRASSNNWLMAGSTCSGLIAENAGRSELINSGLVMVFLIE